jgi:hypothetical protein
MKCISVQQMPNGFEVETPTFGYWFKAGAAFTLGAGIVTVCAAAVWGTIGLMVVSGMFSLLHR